MLISPIDHNKEPDPEKQVNKTNSSYWTLSTNDGPASSAKVQSSHNSEGIILRARDTRLAERRKNPTPPELLERERRVMDNRKNDPRWSSTSHHILVIALERKAGEPEPWKAGDHVSVVPKTKTPTPARQRNEHPSADTQNNKSPILVKDEGDYVLHLSKDSINKR